MIVALNKHPTAVKQSPVEEILPGDLAMWVFILMELTVFALFFVSFAVIKSLEPEMFKLGQDTLHPVIGVTCTLALITSSYFVALAVISIKQSESKKTQRWLTVSILTACIYLVAKTWEYIELGSTGFDLSTNIFYTFYFFTTFFHFMHVILGMIILIYLTVQTSKDTYSSDNHDGFEAGACYWHMVDLVWIILFPIIYVVH